uniref:Uncharacterized protein n=1 Tax=Avena sativa TaxID=4498 RepID=A0ACD5ZPY0_AVESA
MDLICLQETKLRDVSSRKASSFLPRGFTSFVFKNSDGASGGLLTAWRPSSFSHIRDDQRVFTLTSFFEFAVDGTQFAVTNVYAPCLSELRADFLVELRSVASDVAVPWLVLGDFNVSRCEWDKNNGNFDASSAGAFNEVLDDFLLQELPLLDRRFTWTNGRAVPTLVRLDRAFIDPSWQQVLFNSCLRSLVRTTSDHVPLVVEASSRAPISSVFRFERGWAHSEEYRASICAVWADSRNHLPSAGRRLSRSLKWARASSKKWARAKKRPPVVVSNCRAVIDLLDRMEELRALAPHEMLLRDAVKRQLSRMYKQLDVYWKQRFAFKLCKLGDDNTAFFHAGASARLRRNQIKVLHADGVPVACHVGKERILSDFYANLLGESSPPFGVVSLACCLTACLGSPRLRIPSHSRSFGRHSSR